MLNDGINHRLITADVFSRVVFTDKDLLDGLARWHGSRYFYGMCMHGAGSGMIARPRACLGLGSVAYEMI